MDKQIHMHTNTRVCMHAPTDQHTDVPSCLGRLEWKVRINFFLLIFPVRVFFLKRMYIALCNMAEQLYLWLAGDNPIV